MGTATQLLGEPLAAHAQHTHLVVVFLAEQSHGTGFTSGIDIHQFSGDRGVSQNLAIDQNLDLLALGFTHRFAMGEVEAQIVRRHQRAFLLHMVAQHVTQGGVHQVGGRVITHDGATAIHIHVGGHFLAHFQAAAFHLAQVHMGRLAFFGIGHRKTVVALHQETTVAHLTTGFCIKRRAGQHYHAFFPGQESVHRFAVLEQADDFVFVRQFFVT